MADAPDDQRYLKFADSALALRQKTHPNATAEDVKQECINAWTKMSDSKKNSFGARGEESVAEPVEKKAKEDRRPLIPASLMFPRSAYVLFALDKRKDHSVAEEDIPSEWDNISREEEARYNDLAKKESDAYDKEHPDEVQDEGNPCYVEGEGDSD